MSGSPQLAGERIHLMPCVENRGSYLGGILEFLEPFEFGDGIAEFLRKKYIGSANDSPGNEVELSRRSGEYSFEGTGASVPIRLAIDAPSQATQREQAKPYSFRLTQEEDISFRLFPLAPRKGGKDLLRLGNFRLGWRRSVPACGQHGKACERAIECTDDTTFRFVSVDGPERDRESCLQNASDCRQDPGFDRLSDSEMARGENDERDESCYSQIARALTEHRQHTCSESPKRCRRDSAVTGFR
jgi:hypothetical protein